MKRHHVNRAVSMLLSGAMVMGCTAEIVRAEEKKDEEGLYAIYVDGGEKKFDSAKNLYGLFFEDINHAADGGLNPELINNRSFESSTGDSWGQEPGSTAKWSFSEDGTAELKKDRPMYETNPHYLSVNVTKAGYKMYNSGYQGVPARNGETYNFYMWVRNKDFDGNFKVAIVDENGSMLSSEETAVMQENEPGEVPEGWTKYSAAITCHSDKNGKFVLKAEGTGSFDVDFISLMPQDTWKGEEPGKWPYGGLRKDLVEALKELHPRFIRFPGGCIVEGGWGLKNRYQWKNTIGPLEQRQESYNLWYAASPADDPYWQSYGLGYHEYFQLCEDLGAEPLPVVNCAMSCQWRGPEYYEPGSEEFNQEVQDALDLIEYANGGTDTKWGAKRAENGHPEPFNMKFLSLGNENWGNSSGKILMRLKRLLKRFIRKSRSSRRHAPMLQVQNSIIPGNRQMQITEMYIWMNIFTCRRTGS